MTLAVRRCALGHSPGTIALLATLTSMFGFLLVVSAPAHAEMPRVPGMNPNQTVVVERGQVVPEVTSTVGRVEVYGVVEGDVESTMGDVLIRGPVEGDVSSGLGDVRIEAPVGGDIEAGFGDVFIDEFVNGDVEVERGDVVLGENARIIGDVHCGSGLCHYERGAAVDGRMMAGTMNGAVLGESQNPGSSGFVFRWMIGAGLLIGASLLIAVVAPAQLLASSRMVESHPVWSLLVGGGSVVGATVLSVLLAVSVIGLPLLILVAPLYLLLLAFGAVVAAFFIGRKIVLGIGGYRQGNVLAALVGGGIVAAIVLVPLGEVILVLAALLGAGAALMALLRGTALFRKYLPGKGFDRK